jgi:hypothetical protein
MGKLLNHLIDLISNTPEHNYLLKYITRVKSSGRIKSKVDIFTLYHYKVMFLVLNDWNAKNLSV